MLKIIISKETSQTAHRCSRFLVEIAAPKLKKYKLAGSDQIPEEMIQTGDETLQSEIHKLIIVRY
jgi:hypothetical protein